MSADTSGHVKATFSSTFPVGGYAAVRFCRQDRYGGVYGIQGNNCGPQGFYPVYLEPGSKATVEDYGFGVSQDDTVVAAIDLSYSGGQWLPEQFRGSDGKLYDESTYDDNRATCKVGPPPPQGPAAEVHPSTYPVSQTVQVPRYKKVKDYVWVDDWVSVPVEIEEVEGKPAVRLVE
ncbi:hypothetical protein [Desulfothermobacter acidiphilus]|uniref:hypothetical protein n=1 Tax=Desulfothermobacter acidiphilus TaxID=1938353 RepID=UPI003F8CAFA9